MRTTDLHFQDRPSSPNSEAAITCIHGLVADTDENVYSFEADGLTWRDLAKLVRKLQEFESPDISHSGALGASLGGVLTQGESEG